jgi:hypothetical protein
MGFMLRCDIKQAAAASIEHDAVSLPSLAAGGVSNVGINVDPRTRGRVTA